MTCIQHFFSCIYSLLKFILTYNKSLICEQCYISTSGCSGSVQLAKLINRNGNDRYTLCQLMDYFHWHFIYTYTVFIKYPRADCQECVAIFCVFEFPFTMALRSAKGKTLNAPSWLNQPKLCSYCIYTKRHKEWQECL